MVRKNCISAVADRDAIIIPVARNGDKVIAIFSSNFSIAHIAVDGNFIIACARNYRSMRSPWVTPISTFTAAGYYRIVAGTRAYCRKLNVAVVDVVVAVARIDFVIVSLLANISDVDSIVTCARDNLCVARIQRDIILAAAYADISAFDRNFIVAVARVNIFATFRTLDGVISCAERNFVWTARIVDKDGIIAAPRDNAVVWTARIKRNEIFARANIDCRFISARDNRVISAVEWYTIVITTAHDRN